MFSNQIKQVFRLISNELINESILKRTKHSIYQLSTRTMVSSDYTKFRDILRNSKNVVALTGAGISAESGVPTFRGSGGLWKKYR